MLIRRNVKLTIRDKQSFLDEDLYFYQNDRNINILFEIYNFKFDFIKASSIEENIIQKTNPSYSTIRIIKPSGSQILIYKCPIENNLIHFYFTLENYNEIGTYELQITLHDNNFTEESEGRISIPPITFDILEPIFDDTGLIGSEDGIVGEGDVSNEAGTTIITDCEIKGDYLTREEIIPGSGLYEWKIGDYISDGRLNAIHSAILNLEKNSVTGNEYIINIINNNMNNINEQIEEINEKIDNISSVGLGEVKAENVRYTNSSSIAISTVKDALDILLAPELQINSFDVNINNIIEMGRTVESCIFTWSYNDKNIVSQNINGKVLNVSTRTYTYDIPFSSNITFTLVSRNIKNEVRSSKSIIFCNRIFFGALKEPSGYNEDFLNSLSNNLLQSTKNGSVTITANEDQYIYYSYPLRLGEATFKVGGFEGGFDKVSTISYTNSSNFTEDYIIYKSVNSNLGETTIVVS